MQINVVIFYFSQTLNTKKYAEKIAQGVRETGNNCDLLRFMKLDKDKELIKKFHFSKYDLIGFGNPVYYFHPPYHIFEILEMLPSLEGKLGFLFCTSGGNPGSTLYQMKKILDKKGLKIIDGNDGFVGRDKHPLYRDFGLVYPPSLGHPTEEDLANAQIWGSQLVEKAKKPDPLEKTDFHTRDSNYAKIQTKENVNRTYPKFELLEEKCVQCGNCEEICPVDCIFLDPYPKWKDMLCDRCYLCYMECPEQAIECDWKWQADVMTDLMKKKGFLPKKTK